VSDSTILSVHHESEGNGAAALTQSIIKGANGANSATNAILGFLSIVTDSSGVFGGYLVTNAWGRPLEFRLSTAVLPNRVQQILYGPTLAEYLHAELIGKTLVEKTTTQPTLIIADTLAALGLRNRVQIPTLSTAAADGPEYRSLTTERAGQLLAYAAKHVADLPLIHARLEQVDPAVDLAEPFARIREAMLEARKMGVTNRAA